MPPKREGCSVADAGRVGLGGPAEITPKKKKVRVAHPDLFIPARDYLEASKISVTEVFWARSSFSSFVGWNA